MPLTVNFKSVPEVLGSPTSMPKAPSSKDLQSLRKSCRDFEAIYIQEMYKAMRKTVPDSGLFEKDMASELYKEMMDMEIAKSTAAGKGIGIGEAMYQQMKNKLEQR